MRIVFHKQFTRQYKKLRPKEQKRFKTQRDLFLADPYHQSLNNHPLQGKYQGFRSMNVGGDLRVIYTLITNDTAYFVAIDSHSNLYY
ncbi:MAG: hypothetical protein UY09_C0007G0016 [Parcubacteria group bacterium GW2011_GWA2_47_8]|nr:MAG: hypothetical protein UY09_C0007G0016 [Parcubacteria group bacterium GW2011_GWA2_47_8]OHB19669.1 MAG: hypothetical protein A2666_03975 [Parcubacteria group bacterium RIFCSPHIGHO2_01_FULL_47_10b]